MKKVIILLCILAGCQPNISKSPREQLIKTPADWIVRYGDSMESQQTANIVLAIQVIDRQGKAIKELHNRLVVLEKIIDPNEAK